MPAPSWSARRHRCVRVVVGVAAEFAATVAARSRRRHGVGGAGTVVARQGRRRPDRRRGNARHGRPGQRPRRRPDRSERVRARGSSDSTRDRGGRGRRGDVRAEQLGGVRRPAVRASGSGTPGSSAGCRPPGSAPDPSTRVERRTRVVPHDRHHRDVAAVHREEAQHVGACPLVLHRRRSEVGLGVAAVVVPRARDELVRAGRTGPVRTDVVALRPTPSDESSRGSLRRRRPAPPAHPPASDPAAAMSFPALAAGSGAARRHSVHVALIGGSGAVGSGAIGATVDAPGCVGTSVSDCSIGDGCSTLRERRGGCGWSVDRRDLGAGRRQRWSSSNSTRTTAARCGRRGGAGGVDSGHGGGRSGLARFRQRRAGRRARVGHGRRRGSRRRVGRRRVAGVTAPDADSRPTTQRSCVVVVVVVVWCGRGGGTWSSWTGRRRRRRRSALAGAALIGTGASACTTGASATAPTVAAIARAPRRFGVDGRRTGGESESARRLGFMASEPDPVTCTRAAPFRQCRLGTPTTREHATPSPWAAGSRRLTADW